MELRGGGHACSAFIAETQARAPPAPWGRAGQSGVGAGSGAGFSRSPALGVHRRAANAPLSASPGPARPPVPAGLPPTTPNAHPEKEKTEEGKSRGVRTLRAPPAAAARDCPRSPAGGHLRAPSGPRLPAAPAWDLRGKPRPGSRAERKGQRLSGRRPRGPQPATG